MVQYIDSPSESCGEDIAKLKQESKLQYQFDASDLELTFLDNSKESPNAACGSLAHMPKNKTNPTWFFILLILPLIMVFSSRGSNYEN